MRMSREKIGLVVLAALGFAVGARGDSPSPVMDPAALVKDRHVRITAPGGEVLRDFQLDPTRGYQPQPKT